MYSSHVPWLAIFAANVETTYKYLEILLWCYCAIIYIYGWDPERSSCFLNVWRDSYMYLADVKEKKYSLLSHLFDSPM